MTRTYHLKQRAQRQQATRQRIIEAAVELHTTLGPAQTTISAIAQRAGVERLTLYRHFPDEHALLSACSSHYLSTHPLPDPTPWGLIADPQARLRRGLAEVYAYYRRTEQHMAALQRDAQVLPQLREFAAPYLERWGQMRAVLAAAWGGSAPKLPKLSAALGHALDFQSWRSLVRQQGLEDEQVVELMVGMVRCLVAGT
ncbi:MAG TPA: TetR/AcrR family transcriptional regulator [Ktedonobacteraceae bacterium]|nr:TetR/AcrR family transcriptional regulator [Ktedonobacteraceae bacterium]